MGAINDPITPVAFAEALRTINGLRLERDELLEALDAVTRFPDDAQTLLDARALISRVREGT